MTGPFVGYFYQWTGMQVTLLVLGVGSMLLFFVLMLPLLRRIRAEAIRRDVANVAWIFGPGSGSRFRATFFFLSCFIGWLGHCMLTPYFSLMR